ncbi:MAG: hypothetical protein AAGK14_04330 [Verrucomicrobiota bacterium]
MKFEFWIEDGSDTLFDVPRSFRLCGMEPSAVLVAKFECDDWEGAMEIREDLRKGNQPEGIEVVNIPLHECQFQDYQCGVSAGELLSLQSPFEFTLEGSKHHLRATGTQYRVEAGDLDYPGLVYMKSVLPTDPNETVGQASCFPNQKRYLRHFDSIREE